MQRLNNLSKQMNSNVGKDDNDVVICCAVRTPLTKSKRGGLKDTQPEMLIKHILEEIVKRTKIDGGKIEDIVFGNVLQGGAGMYQVRLGSLLAGLPDTTSAMSVNRLCSSGLEACSVVISKIQSGVIDIGVGGGVENMSLYDMQNMIDPSMLSEAIFDHEAARNCLLGMGMTSENVAEKYNISRKEQDQFAVLSQQKAFQAQKAGKFVEEIAPIKTTVKDKDGKESVVIVSQDDGIRQTSEEVLAKLKPAFKKDGTTTAGNSSQVTDGCAGVLFARRKIAVQLGLPILARFRSYATAGVPPQIMGIGPAFAIPLALKKAGLDKNQIDVYEINEAFASQATYCVKVLGLDPSKVNPNGGAIALGHPLGCTGARQICTLLPELKRQNKKLGVVSMCIGTGMGAAGVFERE